MTVEFRAAQAKTGGGVEGAAPKPVDLRDIVSVDPLHQGQALLAAGKKRKKQQKRAGTLMQSLFFLFVIMCHVFIFYSTFSRRDSQKRTAIWGIQHTVLYQ